MQLSYVKNALRFLFACGLLVVMGDLWAQMKTAKQVIVRYRNLFTAPPSKVPGNVAVDGPLLGNGFTAITIAGPPEQQNYYLARNDFWRLKSGLNTTFPAVLGNLKVEMPALLGASYQIEQQ